MRNCLSNQSQSLSGELGCNGIWTAGHIFQSFNSVDLAEDVGVTLLPLDARLHAKMEGSQIAGLFAIGTQNWNQSFQPMFALPVGMCQIGSRKSRGVVGGDKGFHQIQASRLQHLGFNLLVGYQHCNGQAGIVLDVIIVVEGQWEQPHGHLA